MDEEDAPTLDERLEALEEELARLRQSAAVQTLVIGQYKQALADANHQSAILTSQLKLANQPTV